MKTAIVIFCISIALALASCTSNRYDSLTCDRLTEKIERRDSLSQKDYKLMIGQSCAILEYLVEKTESVDRIEDPDERHQASKLLHADPEFMQRFGHLFTFSSILYQADLAGKLDEDNIRRYHDLEEWSDKFADMEENI